MRQSHLVIMAKQPQAGRVKSRLARAIGTAEALRVYRTVLASTVRRLADDSRWHLWIAVTPDSAIGSHVWPRAASLIGQGADGLGERMQHVFDNVPPGPAVIIGSDIPGIEKSDIANAFRNLGGHDAVFGPAPDGGYWLVGARRMPTTPKLFANVRWSTKHALADTRANVSGKRVAMLRKISDLDEEADYLVWRSKLKG